MDFFFEFNVKENEKIQSFRQKYIFACKEHKIHNKNAHLKLNSLLKIGTRNRKNWNTSPESDKIVISASSDRELSNLVMFYICLIRILEHNQRYKVTRKYELLADSIMVYYDVIWLKYIHERKYAILYAHQVLANTFNIYNSKFREIN